MEDSWAKLQKGLGITVPFENYLTHVGKPFPKILELIGLSESCEEIREIYFSNSKTTSVRPKLYPGVHETLTKIKEKNLKIGMITSKPSVTTLPLLEEFDLKKYFDDVQCPDKKHASFGKPNPYYLLTGISSTDCDPQSSLYIGDMQSDWETAERAGVNYLHANWGYGHIDPEIKLTKLDGISDIMSHID